MDKLKKLWHFFTSPEMISYIVFGVLTTAVNIVSFGLFRTVLRWELLMANTLAWILSVAFAFITNKLIVFKSKSFEAGLFFRELITFVGARLLSLGVDTLGMLLLVNVLLWNDWIAKIIMNVIVIIINYVLSKRIIFKNK
ncbi:MAG TPA: GtrA family protein [Caproiciproducens sp.]|nr:GtrA family protein [Caproiciproducens sp.]